jgi:hypothetical protein
MEPRDLPAVWRIARAQNRRDGTCYPVPPIFEMDERSPRFGGYLPNVVLALVTEVDGRVRQMHVWLRTIEQMDFGGGREDTEFSIAHLPMVLGLLAERGYDDLHCFVPRVRVADLEQMLVGQGMNRVDNGLAHFFRMTAGIADRNESEVPA